MPAVLLELVEIFVASISRVMSTKLGSWLVSALAFLGISWVSQKFESSVITQSLAQYFNGMGGDIVAWIAYLKVDKAITVILSAYATVAATRWIMTRTPKASGS